MGVREVFSRIRKTLLWGLGTALLVLVALALLIVYTPAADHVGRLWLGKVLRERGITLQAGETRGTLARGLTVRDLLLEKPGGWRCSVKRAEFKLSLYSLLAARPQLEKVVLEDAAFEARLAAGSGGEAVRLPRLGVSRWVLRGGSIRIVRGQRTLPWLGEWSQLAGEGGFSMGGEGIRLSSQALTGIPGDHRLPALRASGSTSWSFGAGLGLDLRLLSGESVVLLKGHGEGGEAAAGWRGEVRSASLDLALLRPIWPQAPDRRVSGDLRVRAAGPELSWEGPVEAPGSGRWKTKGWLRLGGGAASTEGEAQVEAFSLGTPALFGGLAPLKPEGSGRVRWKAERPASGGWLWELALDVQASRLYGAPLSRGTATVRVADGALSVKGEASSPLCASVKGEVRRDRTGLWSAGASGEGVELEPLLRALGFWRELPAPVRVPTGPWPVVRMDLVRGGQGLRLTASGTPPAASAKAARFSLTIPPGGPGSWSLQTAGLDLASCGSPVAGRADLGLDYSAGAPGAILDAAWERAEVAGVGVDAGRARVRTSGGVVRLEPCSLSGPSGRAELEGRMGPGDSWEGKIAAHLVDIGPAARAVNLGESAGSLDAKVVLAGRPGVLRVSGTALVAGLRRDSFSASQTRAEGTWDTGGGTDLRLAWKGLTARGTALGDGSLDLAGPPGDVRATLKADLGGGRSLGAGGAGTLTPTGADLAVSGTALSLAEFSAVQEGVARLRWDGGAFELENFSLRGSGARLAVTFRGGLAGSWSTAPTAGRLVLDDLPLAMFPLPETAGRLGGKVSADLSWDGTGSAPAVRGRARLRGGSYGFARSDLAWVPVEMDFEAAGDRLELVRAEAASPEGGRATARGWMRLKGLLPGPFQIEATGKAMPFVVGRDVGGATDFDVVLSGTLAEPNIAGRADVLKGRIQLPELSRQAPLPETIHFTNAPAGSPFVPVPEPETPVVGRLRGSVTLHSAGGFWVSSRVLLAEIRGTVAADFTDRGVVLRGSLHLSQGRYLLQGRPLEIAAADLSFEGTPDNVPMLDVTALYRGVQDVEITVRVLGRPEKPKVLLSSRPAMEQSEILALLVTGTRPPEMDEGQKRSWSGAAAALALQYQAGPLLDAVRKRLGLETLNLVTGDTPETAGVGFSKAVGDRVVVEYQQLFGTLPEERLDLRYRINRRLAFRARTSSTTGSGGDLLWEQRY